MIRRVYSDLDSFKTLEFHKGLNIILADKTINATDRQSRNGAGKTSFVELIHFMMGADAGKDSIFRHDALIESMFCLEFDLGDQIVTVSRSGRKPSRIQVEVDDPSSWPFQPRKEKQTGMFVISNEEWRAVLGGEIFGIPAEEKSGSYHPTFRMIFPYFARRENSRGFLEPARHAEKQQENDQQVGLTFLIGLDWSIPHQIEQLRQKEKAIAELRKIARQGTFPDVLGKAAALRTRMTVARGRADRLRDQLGTFRVVPEYRDLEREASNLTLRINSLSNENTSDRELILQLEKATEDEAPPGFDQVERLYSEAGINLSDAVKERFGAVQAFHRRVVENRQAHLQDEINTARQRVTAREWGKERLDERRSQIMGILRDGGALDHYTRLQEELTRQDAEAESLQRQYELAEQLESSQTEYDEERARLHRRLQADYREQSERVGEAILLFEELSEALYEQAGSLTINPTEKGPKFDVKIEASRSKGINNMLIFCFDMTLSIIAARRGIHPGFLIHDSHLFDGVDERQIRRSLELGSEKSVEHNFQYIVTMNSDDMPFDEDNDEWGVLKRVLRQRLTDAETGGLFGIRFE